MPHSNEIDVARAKTSPLLGRRLQGDFVLDVRPKSAGPSSPKHSSSNFLQVPIEMMARPRSNSSPSGTDMPDGRNQLVRQTSEASTAQIDSRSNSPGQDPSLPILRIDGAIKGTQSDEALSRYSSHFLDGRFVTDSSCKSHASHYTKVDKVSSTWHPERRASKLVIHPSPVQGADSFSSSLGAVVDEVLDYNRHERRKTLEIEHSSGGLLNLQTPDATAMTLKDQEGLLFSDGKRRIDMVLVYTEEDFGVVTEQEALRRAKRKLFQEHLEKEGLELEIEDKKNAFDEMTYFVKVHAPWPVITRYAELMNMKMPIKVLKPLLSKNKHSRVDEAPNVSDLQQFSIHTIRRLITIAVKSWEDEEEDTEENNHEEKPPSFYEWFMNLFEYDHSKIPEEPSFYKATFSRAKEEQFVVKDRETFFTSAQRSQIVWQILMRAKYHETEKTGIRRLLNDNTYLAAFPLHEGGGEEDTPTGIMLDRRLLYEGKQGPNHDARTTIFGCVDPLEYRSSVQLKNILLEDTPGNPNLRLKFPNFEWARWGKSFKKQPVWLIRKYFGDKIGLYFHWLGFYTYMLIPPSIMGLLCFFYGLVTLNSSDNIPSKEICDLNGVGNITLCPLCDQACRYIKLGQSCNYSNMTYLFDNPATVFFAIFMSFWATTYLELWKRQHCVTVWEWDLQYTEVDEEPRPEFETSVKTFRINPVTKEKEPYLPTWSRALRFLATGVTVLFMILVVMGAVLGTIIYRISLVSVIYSGSWGYFRDHAKIFTTMTAAVINLIIIMILTKFYHHLALWLTNVENPRTQTEYEDSFTFKIFIFEFVNFYSSLIYIAFFKGKFFEHPGDKDQRSSQWLKLRGDVCDPAGCLSELCIQLAIIMIGKQTLNNMVELLQPKFRNWWLHRYHKQNTKKDLRRKLTRWEEDYQMQDPGRMALFGEYLEMILQYGFVTLFVAAFPLAPLFAFLNNIMEIRLDAYKMLCLSRRPLAERVEDIGAWYGILKGLTYTAVVSNAFVIAYTSDFIPRMVYKYVYSLDQTLNGYVRSTLSAFNTSEYTEEMGSPADDVDPPFCYYRGNRQIQSKNPTAAETYELTPLYWHTFAARLAFVVIFEHIVFALTGVMSYVIPDVPSAVKTQMQRERQLAKEARYERGLKSSGDDDLLRAIKDKNQQKVDHILRRGSWTRRTSRHSDALEAHVDVSSQNHRKISDSTLWEVT